MTEGKAELFPDDLFNKLIETCCDYLNGEKRRLSFAIGNLMKLEQNKEITVAIFELRDERDKIDLAVNMLITTLWNTKLELSRED